MKQLWEKESAISVPTNDKGHTEDLSQTNVRINR